MAEPYKQIARFLLEDLFVSIGEYVHPVSGNAFPE
jgi:hypothetical protein